MERLNKFMELLGVDFNEVFYDGINYYKIDSCGVIWKYYRHRKMWGLDIDTDIYSEFILNDAPIKKVKENEI